MVGLYPNLKDPSPVHPPLQDPNSPAPSDIQIKVGQVCQKGLCALPAKDAKTDPVGQSWWQRWTGGIVNKALALGTAVVSKAADVATGRIQGYAVKYASSLDKTKVIAQSKQTMLDTTEDPQFVEFFDMVSALVAGQAERKIAAMEKSFIALNLQAQRSLIVDLVEINLAKGFANLATLTHEMRDHIPDYHEQPSLVNVLSMLCQKGSAHIDAKRLAQMEEKYRDSRASLPVLTKELFPNIETEPEKRLLIKKLIHTEDPLAAFLIQSMLFADHADPKDKAQIQQFISVCEDLNKRHEEFKQIFTLLADDILSFLFPNRFADMEIPSFLNWGHAYAHMSGAETLYGLFLKDSLVELLQDSYEPLEDDATKREAWKNDLQERLGAPDLKPVIEAPSAFVFALVKDFIQSSPKAVAFTAKGLSKLRGSNIPGNASGKQDEPMAQLSQFQLVNWFIDSTQALLQTEDPHLRGFGKFIDNCFNNLTVAMLSKGAKIVLPEADKVKSNQFINASTDQLVSFYNSIKGDEVIPDQAWKSFIDDLPLPQMLKNLLLPFVIKEYKSRLPLSVSEIKMIEELYFDMEAKVRDFKRGEELISISEKLSELIIDQFIGENFDLVSKFGLEDTFEKKLAQFLPGVKIDDDLKTWFQENLSAFEVSKTGASPKFRMILKRGMQGVILNALVNTIETNFKNNSEDYAAQLLEKIYQAGSKALSGFDETQREELESAFEIKTQLQTKKEQIEALGEELAKKPKVGDKPNEVTPVQMSLLEEVLEANTRLIIANDYIVSLASKLKETLRKLNDAFQGEEWTEEELPFISQAIDLYNRKASTFPTVDGFKVSLQREIEDFIIAEQSEIDVSEKQKKRDAIDVRDVLLEILDMPQEQINLLSDVVTIHATIEHAEREKEKVESDKEAKAKAVKEHDEGKIKNRPAWDEAVVWMEKSLPGRVRLHQLTEEVEALHTQLDSHLKIFQDLSNELAALVGLDQKDKLKLPPNLQDFIWPKIESAKNELFARLLFEQLTPVILVIADVQQNKERLIELSKGDTFLVELAATTAAEVVDRLSDYVTNYHPFAEQILTILGVDDPTQQEIERMEAALRLIMIDAGREGVTAAMIKPHLKGKVLQDKEEAISKSLEKWIGMEDAQELSPDEMLEMLKKETPPQNKKEEEQLEKKAKYLAHTVNEFLINHGKGNLTANDLLEAYQDQVEGRQKKVPQDGIKKALEDLAAGKVIDKIRTVFITHDEIAQALNEIIPGAKDLHTLIAPQLEAVIIGQDDALKANRKFVQEYIEGMLVHRFVKIGEANVEGDQSVLAVMARKLESLVPSAEDLKDRTAEDVASKMIDDVLSDVLGIKSANDLDGIPIVLRTIGYAKLKEKAYLHLTPLLIPMIERNQNRTKLQHLSGSKFLGNLSAALSKDLLNLLPLAVNSYRAIGIELFVLLSGRQPSSAEADDFAKKITQIVNLNKDVAVTSETLAEAYAEVVNVKLTADALQEMAGKLNKQNALENILNVLATPEEMTEAIEEALPTADPMLLEAFAAEVQNLIHNSPQAYQHFSGFAEAYVDGMLLRIFIRLAEKNPPQLKKDSLIILTEKLLDAAAKKFAEAKDRPPEEVAQELNDLIMHELLGVDSPEAFKGLPDPLKEKAYLAIKDQLTGLLIRIQKSLTTLESSEQAVEEAQKRVRKFGISDTAAKGYAQILSEDLANMVVTTVPDVLAEMGSHQMIGVNAISKGIQSYLEELAGGNLALASVLLNYTKGDQFQEMLGDQLENLASQDNFVEDKQKAAGLLANLILVPLNHVLDRAIKLEHSHGEAFNQNLMANILVVAAGHLKNLNEAKKLAAESGRKTILHEDFVAAAGKKLHPAVPVEAVTFEKTIEMISRKIYGRLPPDQFRKWEAEQAALRAALTRLAEEDRTAKTVLSIQSLIREVETINVRVTGGSLKPWQLTALKAADDEGLTLRDLVRQEAETPAVLRQKEFYGPAIKTAMKMIFPNGKKDLTFVPPEFRSQLWKICEKNLFPVVLPMITELLLDPDMINSIVLNSLETVRDNLNRPIVLEKGEPSNRPVDALDQASGALISELLKTVELPDWIKEQMIDPETGEASLVMQKTLGATLRKQFNGKFIKDKIELALETAVVRDEDGHYVLQPNIAPRAEKIAKAEEKREAVLRDLKRVSREVVDVSISYFIRTKWAEAQARFDELVARAFGKIGIKLKQALDLVFDFIFFKVIGTILNVLLFPIKGFVKEGIYDLISLDKNREILLSLLTKAPVDQPRTEGHVVYNEDLVYQIVQTIKQTVEECLNEPVLPGLKKDAPVIAVR